jgi:anaerobic selenocysteine-containing dehydrogenase
VVEGLRRDDLFTVVHELFMTDTADLADIVLPATSNLEQTDLHKAYGHTLLRYNHPAIPPLGHSLSNWDVMRRLAAEMGFDEPWLRQDAEAVIDEVLTATAARSPFLQGVSLERLKAEGQVALNVGPDAPFADGHFPTPSGKVELYSARLAAEGHDPLPNYSGLWDDGEGAPDVRPEGNREEPSRRWRAVKGDEPLDLITPAAHHFVTSSFGNGRSQLRGEGAAIIEIHPTDAAARDIAHGELVIVENGRGCVTLRAVVTEAVRPGVVAAAKGRWSKHGDAAGAPRNVNWTTSDALGDFAGQSTFHSNRVWLRKTGARD